MRVLIVDDEPLSRRAPRTSWVREKTSKSSSRRAMHFEALETFDKKAYDILLLDIHMPELSGIELTDRLNKREGQFPRSCLSPPAGVVYNEEILRGRFTNERVWSLWSDLDNGAFNFPRSMLNTPIAGGPMDCGVPVGTATCGSSGQMTSGVAVNTSVGHGNYNGLFISTKITQETSLGARPWVPELSSRPRYVRRLW